MTINLKLPDIAELKPRITVVGVGGAGGNAVNNMIHSNLEGVEFVVANTDAQALRQSAAERRIQMGAALTEGLGAGSQPQIGAAAAEEALPEIIDHLSGSHMAFITAGMGGGTGTGAAPIIARAAREQGILTVAVVTKPFHFEGQRRMALGEHGIQELAHHSDTLIVIPNQNLFRIANEKTTFADAFAMADQVLYSGVAGITDLMVKEGLINLDFADVRAVMNEMGKAMMGTGEASGEKRAIDAAEAAISNPLLDDVSMKGARGLLISITGGKDLTLYEVDEAASRIREEIDPEANIILGATFDESLEGIIRVSVVATGIEMEPASQVIEEDAEGDAVAPAGGYAMDEAFANMPHAEKAEPPAETPAKEGEPAPEYLVAAEPQEPAPAATAAGRPQHYYGTEEALAELASEPEAAADDSAGALRMPEVEDFPPIAQRQLQAHAGEPAETGLREQTRKSGFLERLANVGLGRKTPIGKPTQHEEAAPRAEPALQPQPAPAAANAAAADEGNVAPLPQAEEREQQPAAPAAEAQEELEEDELEIPAFLRRQAN